MTKEKENTAKKCNEKWNVVTQLKVRSLNVQVLREVYIHKLKQ